MRFKADNLNKLKNLCSKEIGEKIKVFQFYIVPYVLYVCKLTNKLLQKCQNINNSNAFSCSYVNNFKDKVSLNSYLENKSYIVGYEPTQFDTELFLSLNEDVLLQFKNQYPHLWRWFVHIKSFGAEICDFPKCKEVRDEFFHTKTLCLSMTACIYVTVGSKSY